jgi:uncharacterized membrane protein
MDKQEFLCNLQKGLRYKYTRDEISDILLDYDDFFAQGISEGKNEQQICLEMGEPHIIVQNLVEERKRKPLFTISSRWRIALCIMLGVIAFAFFGVDSLTTGTLIRYIGIIIGFSVVLWFIMFDKAKKLASASYEINKRKSRIIWLFHLIIPVSLIINYFLLVAVFTQLRFDNYSFILLLLTRTFSTAATILPLLVAIISIVRFYSTTSWYFTIIVHAIGAMACANTIGDSIFNVGGFDSNQIMLLSLALYCLAIFMAGVYAIILRYLSRRSE